MKPPYEITSSILKLITSISEKIGEINANLLNKPSPKLRKQNRIKTIYSSLKIEGNTLTEEQITALLENKRVIGPKKYVLEVLEFITEKDGNNGYLASGKIKHIGYMKGKFKTKKMLFRIIIDIIHICVL